MSSLTIMVGEAGSGKSTEARKICKQSGFQKIRVNRDDLRAMLFNSEWSGKREDLVRKVEREIAKVAIEQGYGVVVDDTNLIERTKQSWVNLARESNVMHSYRVMDTEFEECVRRDFYREGKAKVGRAVIERQFLTSGRAKFGDKPIVIVDVDGTLADCTGVRNPYDESRVHLDNPYPVVVQWVRNLVHASGYCQNCGGWIPKHEIEMSLDDCEPHLTGCNNRIPVPEYSVVIVSGRHDTCGEQTITWLNAQGITFDHIFMRNGGDNRPDTVVKQEILDGILRFVPKDQIAFVIDDRPKVIEMWRSNGLRVFPARGAVEDF